MWRKLVDITMQQNQLTYQRLNVTLTEDDIMGESLYNPMLPGIVADLKAKGLAVESEGATVVFLDEYKTRKANLWVLSFRKKTVATFIQQPILLVLNIVTKIYMLIVFSIISTRQHQHLMQAWTIVRKAGYIPDSMSLEHHMFGMMLGKDGRPFKTRSGGTIRLTDLLDEAQERARTLIAEKIQIWIKTN